MTIDEALRSYLLTVTPITSRVVARIYPAVASAGAVAPYITYTEIAVNEAAVNNAESYNKYYQFTVYAKTYSETRVLIEALETAFYHKPIATYSGIRLLGGSLSGSRDLPFDTTSALFSAAVDIKMNYVKS